MGIWKARLMALLSVVAMLVAFSAPVALADEDGDCEFRDQRDRFVCSDDGDRDVFTANEVENLLEDDCDDFLFDCDEDDDNDLAEAFFVPFFIEDIDVDCDGIDDDNDGGIDEDAVCEVELEFPGGEDIEFLAEVDDIF